MPQSMTSDGSVLTSSPSVRLLGVDRLLRNSRAMRRYKALPSSALRQAGTDLRHRRSASRMSANVGGKSNQRREHGQRKAHEESLRRVQPRRYPERSGGDEPGHQVVSGGEQS